SPFKAGASSSGKNSKGLSPKSSYSHRSSSPLDPMSSILNEFGPSLARSPRMFPRVNVAVDDPASIFRKSTILWLENSAGRTLLTENDGWVPDVGASTERFSTRPFFCEVNQYAEVLRPHRGVGRRPSAVGPRQGPGPGDSRPGRPGCPLAAPGSAGR